MTDALETARWVAEDEGMWSAIDGRRDLLIACLAEIDRLKLEIAGLMEERAQ